jgi:hypothetical protein
MFLVGDTADDRRERILKFLATEPAIAVLLAAIHFEWTLNRAILKLSDKPTASLRAQLASVYGLDTYKAAWREYVVAATWPKIVRNWGEVKQAFKLRNALVHGAVGCSARFAKPRVNALLKAAATMQGYADSRDHDLYSKLKTRRRSVARATTST